MKDFDLFPHIISIIEWRTKYKELQRFSGIKQDSHEIMTFEMMLEEIHAHTYDS